MRTYKGTLITLDTIIYLPFRYINGNTAFFISCSTCREGTVFHTCFRKGADRQFVAFQSGHGLLNLSDKFRLVCSFNGLIIFCIGPMLRNLYLNQSINTHINSFVIHVNNFLALSAISCNYGFFQILNSIIQRDYIGQFEEC